MENVKTVIDILKAYGLKLRIIKFHLVRARLGLGLEILGHIVDALGIYPD